MKRDLSGLKIEQKRKQPKQAFRPVFLVVAAVVLIFLALLFVVQDRFAPTAIEGPTATAAVDEPGPTLPVGEGREQLIASGYVVANHKIDLGSKVMGKVRWIGVDKGDRVRRGQLLVKLEDDEYLAQLNRAMASLKGAEARLLEMQTGSRKEEIERGRAELDRAMAESKNAGLELERLTVLLQQGVVAEQLVDDARARSQVAEAGVGMARKNLDLLELGPRVEQVQQAQAEVERAEAEVAYYRALLDATEIRAPIDGTILERIAEVGELITTSFAGELGAKSAVVSLADLNDLQVELDISQSDFKKISRENECLMRPEAYLDRQYACVIDEISPEADRQKATIQVKVRIRDPDEYLRPEMSARVTFSSPEKGGL